MVENRSSESVPLNRLAQDSEQYETYGRNTINRNPEVAWSKTRIAIILLSVFSFAAVSTAIAIGVTKGKTKGKYYTYLLIC